MTEFKRILVPLDGSSLSERALPVAVALAEKFGSLIILLRSAEVAVSLVAAIDAAVSLRMNELQEQLYDESERYLKALAEQVRQQGVNVQILVSDAAPAESILKVAVTEYVDLIVMSTHGLGGLARWAFGSVADKVTRHSHCPVLLVRQMPKSVDQA
jgi:nucleotide-binding universal stress UspA family protein